MPWVNRLVAQCAGTLEHCDLPRTLPWYFGVAIAAVWLGAVAGVGLLLRRRLIVRRAARRAARRRAVDRRRSSDVELW